MEQAVEQAEFRASSGTASGCYTAGPLAACVSAITVTAQGYPIVVGGGGPSGTVTVPIGTSNGKLGTKGSTFKCFRYNIDRWWIWSWC